MLFGIHLDDNTNSKLYAIDSLYCEVSASRNATLIHVLA